jgi:hypothetical protein
MANFNFCFKGDRTYVQGGDIYNSVDGFLKSRFGKAYSYIDFFSLNRLTSRNLTGNVTGIGESESSAQSVVSCRFSIASENKSLYLLETEHHVNCRYEYDEESVISNHVISTEQQRIDMQNEGAYSPIEIIIALNKRLLQKLFASERGKWLFTRLMLNRSLPETPATCFSIVLKQNLGCRLTSSLITIDDERYGDIYFSLVRGLK